MCTARVRRLIPLTTGFSAHRPEDTLAAADAFEPAVTMAGNGSRPVYVQCGRWRFVGAMALCATLAACNTVKEVAGTVFTLGIGAVIPGHEIREIYYVGVLDPEEQVPPAFYRITVRGEASIVNTVKFASGWVDSRLVDSLETSIRFGDDGKVAFEGGAGRTQLTPGRRLWMFGPEGFRQAPRDHRLVIVMGASPSAFFEAVDQVMGEMKVARGIGGNDGAARQTLALLQLVDEQQTETRSLHAGPVAPAGGVAR